jgi:ligand-binding sensor domain-containing protein
MRQKLTIIFAVLIILAALFFMTKDYFFDKKETEKNPYEYDLSDLKETDSNQICYKIALKISPDLENLTAVATDKNGRIYVGGNEDVGKILIYDSKGQLLESVEMRPEISALSINPEGKMFVAMNDFVEVWDTMGVLYDIWKKPNEKAIFTSIAATEQDVFVADAGNKLVHHYNLNGKILHEIGSKDSIKGVRGFVIPSPYFDLAPGRDNEIWVVNPGRHSLEAYTYNGELISSWKRTSMSLDGFSGCCNPTHMAILSDGSFVTSEKGLVRVKIHLPSGDFKCLVAGPEHFEEGTKGIDLAIDHNDRIIVMDPYNGEVIIFEKL